MAKTDYKKFHSLLHKEDYEFLKARFDKGGVKEDVGMSRAIRTIIHQRVLGMKLKESRAVDQLKDEERETGEEGLGKL